MSLNSLQSRRLVLAWFALILYWAALYLPGLGIRELKGEEARRALPAVEMLRTGNWVVPHLHGTPYLRKPTLINWLIAASIKVTHSQSDWAVRLPSVLMMLAMAAAIFATARQWLPLSGAWMAAIISLSGVGLAEKGRLAEIEAVYVGLTGIAFAWGLAAWVNKRTGWRLWLVPAICLGLGLLTKGPAQWLFFYAVIVALLIAARETRQLLSLPHLGSIALALLLFSAWAIPYFEATAAEHAETVWVDQMQQRIGGGSISQIGANLLRAFADGLPWILFAPLWWNSKVLAQLDERRRTLVCAARWPLVVGFFGLMLVPGMLPRYTLPLYPAAALLLALVLPSVSSGSQKIWRWINWGIFGLALAAAALCPILVRPFTPEWLSLLPVLLLLGFVALPAWRGFLREESVLRLVAGSALAVAAALGIYASFLMPKIYAVMTVRMAGAQIDAAIPPTSRLHVVDPGYQPILFYVTRPCVFVPSASKLPVETEYVLLSKKDWESARKRLGGGRALARFGPDGKKQILLIQSPH